MRIEEVGFEYGDGRRMEEVVCPSLSEPSSQHRTVLEGQSEKWSFDLEPWRGFIRRGEPLPVYFYFRDATGRYYRALWLNDKIRSALME